MADILQIDLETYSTTDIDVGPHRYAEDPNTGVWCAAFAFDEGPVQTWWQGRGLVDAIEAHVRAGGYIRAFNASFERALWRVLGARHGWTIPRPEQFLCSAALAARAGLPRKLEAAAKVLGLPEQKDMEGHRLMMKMCKPVSLDANGTPIWYTPSVQDAGRLLQYCIQDVETERALVRRLPNVGHPFERKIFLLDQTINDRGVRIDYPLVLAAREVSRGAVSAINATLAAATDGAVEGVTKVAKMKQWLADHGFEAESLSKAVLRDTLALDTVSPEVRQVLLLRQQGGKSSTAKLSTMLDCASPRDNRVRGMLRYYGAGTGRWAGQTVQPQNFPRGTVKMNEFLYVLIGSGDWQEVDMFLDRGVPLMEVMASMLRGCFIPADGHEFVAADFSAIEARVLAWVAGASKLLEAFRTGGSAYLDMSEVIYGRRVNKDFDPTEYQISKNTVLGCGYQMGADKYVEQLQIQTGIVLEPAFGKRAVDAYRSLHWEVPVLWRSMNSTVQAVVSGEVAGWVEVPATQGKIAFAIDESGWLKMRLPSGRSLWYPSPRMSQRKAPWGDLVPCVTTAGVNPETKQWGRQALYGGLLTENAVQAIARDLMAEAMFRVEDAGYPVVLTVHDEIVTELPAGFGSVKDFCRLMAALPDWAEGCPVAAEGWRGTRYRK